MRKVNFIFIFTKNKANKMSLIVNTDCPIRDDTALQAASTLCFYQLHSHTLYSKCLLAISQLLLTSEKYTQQT